MSRGRAYPLEREYFVLVLAQPSAQIGQALVGLGNVAVWGARHEHNGHQGHMQGQRTCCDGPALLGAASGTGVLRTRTWRLRFWAGVGRGMHRCGGRRGCRRGCCGGVATGWDTELGRTGLDCVCDSVCDCFCDCVNSIIFLCVASALASHGAAMMSAREIRRVGTRSHARDVPL